MEGGQRMPIHRPGQTVRETPTHVLTLPWMSNLGKLLTWAKPLKQLACYTTALCGIS